MAGGVPAGPAAEVGALGELGVGGVALAVLGEVHRAGAGGVEAVDHGQVGPLQQADSQREVIKRQTELAQREAELRQQQLVAEVVKPAEADAERVRVLAQAEADRIKIQAEAAASHNRVALDRMLIDQLPQIVREAAAGLANADITVLNGADGLGEIAAGAPLLDLQRKG